MLRRVGALILLLAFAPVGICVTLMPIIMMFVLPDLILLALRAVGVTRDGLVATSGPFGVVIGGAAMYWRAPLIRGLDKWTTPVEYVSDRLNAVITGMPR